MRPWLRCPGAGAARLLLPIIAAKFLPPVLATWYADHMDFQNATRYVILTCGKFGRPNQTVYRIKLVNCSPG